MKSSAKKVELAPYDDLFSTEESRQDAKLEKIQEIPLSELHPFKGHPFKVKDFRGLDGRAGRVEVKFARAGMQLAVRTVVLKAKQDFARLYRVGGQV